MDLIAASLPSLVISYLPALLCGIHVVRTGQPMYWLWILVIAGPLGALIYFFAVLMPEWMGGRTARGVGKAARQALDPERDYRAAKIALEETPTIGNRMRLANASEALDRWPEAETHWAAAAAQSSDDPAVLMGHARVLLQLERYGDALARLEQLKALGREGETAQVRLAFARAYEGLGRNEDADRDYRFAADRVPGLEAGGRYVAFLARTGRTADAEAGLSELDRRLQKIAPPLRPEARHWRDLAARPLGR